MGRRSTRPAQSGDGIQHREWRVKFRREVLSSAPFDRIDKEFLIGIEQGITQPEALRTLAGYDLSEVRVPHGSEVLASPNLHAQTFFHPKIYCFENTQSGEIQILSSSANLSHRGLLVSIEQFLTWSGDAGDRAGGVFAIGSRIDCTFRHSALRVSGRGQPTLDRAARPLDRPGDHELPVGGKQGGLRLDRGLAAALRRIDRSFGPTSRTAVSSHLSQWGRHPPLAD
jgi:hypothetical protein